MVNAGTGNPEKSAIILQIKDGKAQYYETIEP